MNRVDSSRWYAPILGGAALLACGFLLRGKPGERIVYREREVAKAETKSEATQTQATAAKATQATAALAVNRKQAKKVDIHVKPDGEKRVTIVEADEATVTALAEERAQELVAMARAEEREAVKAEMARSIDLRVREPEQPRWSLGGGVTGSGADPDGGYVSVGVRAFGPLWVKCQMARINRADGTEYRWSCGGEATW